MQAFDYSLWFPSPFGALSAEHCAVTQAVDFLPFQEAQIEKCSQAKSKSCKSQRFNSFISRVDSSGLCGSFPPIPSNSRLFKYFVQVL
jgi:hypothetical protein